MQGNSMPWFTYILPLTQVYISCKFNNRCRTITSFTLFSLYKVKKIIHNRANMKPNMYVNFRK